MAEAVLRKLAEDSRFHPSRPLGYAHLKIVRIDCDDDCCPDALVHEVDEMARSVSQARQKPVCWKAASCPSRERRESGSRSQEVASPSM